MKILTVTSANTPMGGTVAKIRRLALNSRNQHVLYFYCSSSNIDIALSEEPFYSEHRIKTYYGAFGNNLLKHALLIRRIIKNEKIDIVHFYFHAETPVVLILKLICPNIKYVRSFVGNVKQSGIKKWLLKRSLRKIDKIVYISNYIKKCYETDLPFLKYHPSEIIYNAPINVYTTEKTQAERTLITYVGGLNVHKNVPLLIDMMNSVVNKFARKDIVLTIIGDGPDRQMIEQMINKYGIKEQILLKGYQKNIPEYLENTQVYVHAATNEGFGISIVEAMYMKCPCIVADASALPELVDNNSGYVLSVNQPDLWAEKLIYLVDNPEVREKMGKAAYIRANNEFSVEKFIRLHDELYESL